MPGATAWQAVLEATLDRWFTPAFRSAGKDQPARRRLLTDDVEGWAKPGTRWATSTRCRACRRSEVPTLCIAGELDKSSPPPIVEEIANAIPGARFAIIPGAPHMLFIEQPEQTARLVRDFLQ